MKWSLIATVLPYHPLWLGQKTCPKCNTKSSRCSLFPRALGSLLSFTNSSNWLLDWPSWSNWFLSYNIHICYLPAWRSVWWKTVTEDLKMLPEAVGRGQHFEDWGHSFSPYGPTLSRLRTHIYIFKLNEVLPKEPEWLRAVNTARSSTNWTIFERVNGT